MSQYDTIIIPSEAESYQEYINRLLPNRLLGKNNRPDGFYTEGHHILPRCLGGKDNKENIIIILPEEHYFCHKLLALEYPHESKLQFAWWSMCHQADSDTKRYYTVSSEDYGEARRRVAFYTQEMNSIPVVEIASGVTYKSAEEAARVLKIIQSSNITSCCKGKAKSANGYKFCYLSDYLIGNYENKTIGHRKRIIDLETEKVYESSVDAANELGLSGIKIREVCRGLRKSTRRHRFVYYEDYLAGNYSKKVMGHFYRYIQDVDTGIVYNSAAEAGRELNIDSSTILKVCHGKVKAVKGHKFIFYSENTENNN